MNEQIQLLIDLLLQNKVDISLDMLRDKDYMNNLIDIINLYLSKYQDIEFNDIKIDTSLEEVKKSTRDILRRIIGKQLFENIDKLIEELHITYSKEFDASVRLTKDSNNNYKVNKIFLSDYKSIIAPSAITHECGHAIVLDNVNLTGFKNEYFELFSILIDKITSYEIENIDSKYKGVQDVNNGFRRIDFCKKAKSFLNSSKNNIPENNKYIIQLLTSQIIIGEIYATLLFNKYLEDKELFIYLFDLVFNSVMSTKEFLLYYGIRINSNTYDELKLLLK